MARHRFLILIGILLATLGTQTSSYASSTRPIVLSDDLHSPLLLTPYLYQRDDLENEITEGKILHSEFHPLAHDFSLFFKGRVWLTLTLENPTAHPKHLILFNNTPYADTLKLYERRQNSLTLLGIQGDGQATQGGGRSQRTPSFELRAAPGQTTFYISLETTGPTYLRFYLQDHISNLADSQRLMLGIGLLFGGVILLLIYNAFLSLRLSYNFLYLYCAFNFLFLLNQFFLSGLMATFTPDPLMDLGVINHGLIFTGEAAGILALLFGRDFLELAKKHARLDLLVKCLLPLSAGNMVLCLFTLEIPTYLIFINNTATALITISSGLIRAREGYRPAYFYTLAWIFTGLGSMVTVGAIFGILDLNIWTTWSLLVGGVAQMTLLSLAVGDRIRQEQDTARRNIENLNKYLEEKVQNEIQINQELKRMDTLKDEFLANTSHELRTPLHAITGLTEAILQESSLSQKTKSLLQMTLGSSRRLSSLVNDILDFSKLRHEQLQLKLSFVDLAKLSDLVLELMRPMLAQKPVELVLICPRPLPQLQLDENRMQQILINLLSNAIKFTPSGTVTLTLIWDRSELLISVKDTGIGIALDQQKRIFESFVQADGSTAREFGGTGLGLTICKRLVELHGGNIELRSAIDQGSEFICKIPCIGAPKEAPALNPLKTIYKAESNTQNREPSLNQVTYRGRILIADDEPMNIEVLEAHLSSSGYEVVRANEGQEALEKAAKLKNIDAALIDVMMPRMSGLEVTQTMRKMPQFSDLPILLLTAKSQTSDVVQGLQSGANDYLVKPFARQELLARLETHITVRNQSKRLRHLAESLQLELMAKADMVRDLAHRGNNPLQSGSLSLETMHTELNKIIDCILELLDSDSEAKTLQEKLRSDANAIEKEYINIREQLKRLTLAIRDIRIVSGIDGYDMQDTSLNTLTESILARLKEDVSQADWNRFQFICPNPKLMINAQQTITVIVLEKLITRLLRDHIGQIKLICCEESRTDHFVFRVQIEGNQRLSQDFRATLQSCHHSLAGCQMSLLMEENSQNFSLKSHPIAA